jgi:hypothetical protein
VRLQLKLVKVQQRAHHQHAPVFCKQAARRAVGRGGAGGVGPGVR